MTHVNGEKLTLNKWKVVVHGRGKKKTKRRLSQDWTAVFNKLKAFKQPRMPEITMIAMQMPEM